MKALFVSLVALFFAFFIGCQENSITDPVTNETGTELTIANTSEVDKDVFNSYPDIIELSGSIFDPSHRLNSFAEIKGVVRYKVEKIYTESRPPRPTLKVNLYVNAEFLSGCPMQDRPWTVGKAAEELIYLSQFDPGVYFIEKSFKVCNTCCHPLKLVIKFELSSNVLKVVSTNLKLDKTKVPFVNSTL